MLMGSNRDEMRTFLADKPVLRALFANVFVADASGQVRLLVDAIGSFGIPLRLCRPLRRAGGEVARFNPALPMQGKGSANWRNHRKIAVFDGTVAIIGGQNLGLRYMGEKPSPRRFRDCSFLIQGPTAAAIERVFVADWCQATDEPPMRFATLLRERCPHVGPARVEVIASGPDCEGDPLWEAYEKLFSNCKRSITVVTPYFIPDRTLFTLLVTAAHAGRHASDFTMSLPVAGVDGTLRRSRSTPGRAHLKTGSLRDVAAVAGERHQGVGGGQQLHLALIELGAQGQGLGARLPGVLHPAAGIGLGQLSQRQSSRKTLPDGLQLGTLCVIDLVPHGEPLNEFQRQGLAVMAGAAMRRLRSRRAGLAAGLPGGDRGAQARQSLPGGRRPLARGLGAPPFHHLRSPDHGRHRPAGRRRHPGLARGARRRTPY